MFGKKNTKPASGGEKQAVQIPASKENEMETCVLCGKTTEVPRNLSVEKREFYVEGAGQLCQSCYYELYIRKGRE